MSRVDPECFHQSCAEVFVCAKCFDDPDLTRWVEDVDGPPGCSFCHKADAPTAPFDQIAAHIRIRLELFYGKAADQLPYESREGGYQAWHTTTLELLVEYVGIELPRDTENKLLYELAGGIGDDTWCEYDWLSLDPDDSFNSSWESFCELVKHDRRFFFHDWGANQESHADDRSPSQFLDELARHIDGHGLIGEEPKSYRVYRARVRTGGELHESAAALGPPPPSLAIQSNRMNPPGISMLYAAENPALAAAEIHNSSVSIGTFETTRPIRVLDLAELPEVPGIFSNADRIDRLILAFLAKFSRLIAEPVSRNDRTQIDYVPTQVFTEFLRDFSFDAGNIDGVRYRSATGRAGANVVLFATPDNVVGASPDTELGEEPNRWLQLIGVEHRNEEI